MLQPEPGQVAFFPIVEAIQEFKVEVNSPPAEFGRFKENRQEDYTNLILDHGWDSLIASRTKRLCARVMA